MSSKILWDGLQFRVVQEADGHVYPQAKKGDQWEIQHNKVNLGYSILTAALEDAYKEIDILKARISKLNEGLTNDV